MTRAYVRRSSVEGAGVLGLGDSVGLGADTGLGDGPGVGDAAGVDDATGTGTASPWLGATRGGRLTLIGWGAHEYHWEVPEHGGSVSLQARPMPAAMVAARAAQQREAQTVRTGLAFGLAHSVGAAFVANGIALADVVDGIDG